MKKLFWNDYYGMSSGFSIFFIAITTMAFAALIAGMFAKTSCYKTYDSYSPQWGFMSGCRIVWDDKLTPVDMVKNINVSK